MIRYKLKYILNIMFMVLCLFTWQTAIAQPPCPTTSNSDSAKWAGGEKNLEGHFLKHKGENNTWTSTSAYTSSATTALGSSTYHTIQNGPNAGRMMFWSADSGSSNTGVFVVTTKDKKIISAFKPSSGKSYYDRQIAKDNSNDGGPGSSSATSRASSDENDSDIWTIYTTYQCNPHDDL